MKYRLYCRDIAIACSGISVEFGWAVGAAVVLPHLLRSPLPSSPALVGVIYIANPILGFFIGPALGKASDRTGRRRNWITILALLAIFIDVILIISSSVKMSRAAEVKICLLAFGLMDLCHDLILIPGRALLIDRFSLRSRDVMGKEDGGVADTMYTTMQILGRLCGLFVGSFPIQNWFPFHASHYQATLATSAVVLLVTNSLAVTFAHEKRLSTTVEDISLYNLLELEPLSGTEAQYEKVDTKEVLRCWCGETYVLTMLLIVNLIGWTSIVAFNFWCTAWLGHQISSAGTSLSLPMVIMTMQALLGFVFSFFLPKLNQCFPIAWVWLLFQLINLGSICSSRLLGPENPTATFVVLVIGCGPTYTVHLTNVQLLARAVVSGDSNIGWVAGLLNSTMSLAQILVAGVFAVFLVCNQPADGSILPCPQIGQVLFFWIGLIGFVIDLFIFAVDICYFEGRIFSIQAKVKRRESLRQVLSHEQDI